MSKLIINTKLSLFKPIEVEIDGVSYTVTRLNKAVFDKLKEFEKAALKGELNALFSQLQAFLPKLNGDVLARLDVREIRSIINFITKQIFKSERETSTEEKNESRPGQAK